MKGGAEMPSRLVEALTELSKAFENVVTAFADTARDEDEDMYEEAKRCYEFYSAYLANDNHRSLHDYEYYLYNWGAYVEDGTDYTKEK